MILYVKGNIFESPAQVLVNTVNTVGVMGRGIAYDFKRMFPEMFDEYRRLCEAGDIRIGTLWLYKSPNKWVLNFPTKQDWRQPSRVEYIEAGLRKFVESYSKMRIHSIAFPPLGCGNGQLDFAAQVQPLMEQYLRNLPIEVFIYAGRAVGSVEHLDIAETKRWLRSEPQSLPFSEVWDDLRTLLAQQHTFQTPSRRSEFTARLVEAPPAIEVTAGRQKYSIPYDTLTSFWQQLRNHGFSTRHIAPSVDRETSYLMPIFAELSYVSTVSVSDSYKQLESASVTGLQVLPSAFARDTQNGANADQLTLF